MLRRKTKLIQDESQNSDQEDSKVEESHKAPKKFAEIPEAQRYFAIEKQSTNTEVTVQRDVKKLGAKIIYSKSRQSIVRGIRTKDELLNKTQSRSTTPKEINQELLFNQESTKGSNDIARSNIFQSSIESSGSLCLQTPVTDKNINGKSNSVADITPEPLIKSVEMSSNCNNKNFLIPESLTYNDKNYFENNSCLEKNSFQTNFNEKYPYLNQKSDDKILTELSVKKTPVNNKIITDKLTTEDKQVITEASSFKKYNENFSDQSHSDLFENLNYKNYNLNQNIEDACEVNNKVLEMDSKNNTSDNTKIYKNDEDKIVYENFQRLENFDGTHEKNQKIKELNENKKNTHEILKDSSKNRGIESMNQQKEKISYQENNMKVSDDKSEIKNLKTNKNHKVTENHIEFICFEQNKNKEFDIKKKVETEVFASKVQESNYCAEDFKESKPANDHKNISDFNQILQKNDSEKNNINVNERLTYSDEKNYMYTYQEPVKSSEAEILKKNEYESMIKEFEKIEISSVNQGKNYQYQPQNIKGNEYNLYQHYNTSDQYSMNHPQMAYAQPYYGSNFIPYQHFNHFVPPPMYTHPVVRYSSVYPQQPLIYDPNIVQNPPFEQYIPKVPDPAAQAYAQWQAEYYRWYQIFIESQRRSSVGAISKGGSITSKKSQYAGSLNFENYSKNEKDNISLFGDIFSKIESKPHENMQNEIYSRLTPFLHSNEHSVSRISYNTLVIASHREIAIYNLEIKDIDSEFPGPLVDNESTMRKLSKYMQKKIDESHIIVEPVKLLWKIMLHMIKTRCRVDFGELSEIMIDYNQKLTSSQHLHSNIVACSGQNHLNIIYSLLNNDLKQSLNQASSSSNWGLMFALSLSDEETLRNTINRYVESLDYHDLLRSYISLKSNIPIDISLIKDFELVKNWSQHVALFLSQFQTHGDVCCTYVYNIAKILQSKGCWNEYQVCLILLDLVMGAENIETPVFYPEICLARQSLDLSQNEIILLRTLEIYEYLKSLIRPTFSYPFVQIYKFSLCEMLVFCKNKNICLEYLKSISKSILSDYSSYSHNFLHKYIKLSKNIFYKCFYSTKFPSWISKLEEQFNNIFDNTKSAENSNGIIISDITQTSPVLTLSQPEIIKTESIIKNMFPDNSLDSKIITEKVKDLIEPNAEIVTEIEFHPFNSNFMPTFPSFQPIIETPLSKTDPSISHKNQPIPIKKSFQSNIPQNFSNESKDLQKIDEDKTCYDKNLCDTRESENKSSIIKNASSILGRIFRSRDQVYLPEDTEKNIIFDKKSNRYIDKSNPNDDHNNLISPPPKSIKSIDPEIQPNKNNISRPLNRYVPPKY